MANPHRTRPLESRGKQEREKEPAPQGTRIFWAFFAIVALRWLIDVGLPLIDYSPSRSDPTTGPAAAANPLYWGALTTAFFVACVGGARVGLWLPGGRSTAKGPENTRQIALAGTCDEALRMLTVIAALALLLRTAYILSSGVSLEALAQRAVFTDETLFSNPWLNLLSLVGDWATPLAVAMLLSRTRFRVTAYGTLILVVTVGVLTGGRGMALTPLLMWGVLSLVTGQMGVTRRIGATFFSGLLAIGALMQIGASRFSLSFFDVAQRTLLRPKRLDDLAFAAELRGAGIQIDLSEVLIGSVNSGLPVGLAEGTRTVLAQVADQLPNIAIRTSGNSGTTLSGAAEGYLVGGVPGMLLLGLALGGLTAVLAQAASRLPEPIRMFVLVSVLILLFGGAGSRTFAAMGLVTVSVLLPLGIVRMFLFERRDERSGRFLNVAASIAMALGLSLFVLVNSKLTDTGALEVLSKLLVAAGAVLPVVVAVVWLSGGGRTGVRTPRDPVASAPGVRRP